jgi:hypothetical protein
MFYNNVGAFFKIQVRPDHNRKMEQKAQTRLKLSLKLHVVSFILAVSIRFVIQGSLV